MDHIKMDYDMATAEERVQKVEEITANTPPEKLSPSYLDELANYMVTPIKKEDYNREQIKEQIKKNEYEGNFLLGTRVQIKKWRRWNL